MYDLGYELTQNDKEAFRLYRISAEKGDIYAQYNLGLRMTTEKVFKKTTH
jgi:TPR repeat protein